MRPSSAPHGQAEMTSAMVRNFAATHLGRPMTHRPGPNQLDDEPPTDPPSTDSSFNEAAHARHTHAHTALLPHQQYRRDHLENSWTGHHEEDEEEEEEEVEPDRDDADQHEEEADEESHFEVEQRADEEDEEEQEEEDAGPDPEEEDAEEEHEPEHDEDNGDAANAPPRNNERVKVAVRCRPVLPAEHGGTGVNARVGVRSCVHIDGREVLLARARVFAFDFAFGPERTQAEVYAECVAPLTNAFWQGFHATVFAYGQTGSGKTHTMGSSGATGVAESDLGIIPRAVRDIFARARHATSRGIVVSTRVSYIEIYNEELKDLLHPAAVGGSRPAPISIREEASGGVVLVGVREEEVRDFADMMRCLARGSLARTTGSTRMNEHSSRSHSIFTIVLEQRRPAAIGGGGRQAPRDLLTRSKFHLVDLAGSERAKKTGAVGIRFKESVNINRGLLALGNVIQALSTPAANGSTAPAPRHVPYRDSKLTHLLKSSIGGNSRTLMVSCISPLDASFEETHTTLKYAARARNIRNRPVVNKKEEPAPVLPQTTTIDTSAAQAAALAAVSAAKDADIGRMQREIARLQSQLSSARVREVAPRNDQEEEEEEEDQSERDQTTDDDDGDTTAVEAATSVSSSSLRARHAHLAHAHQDVTVLFRALASEHAWLLSGLIFFGRNLNEFYALEKRRDEVKERVIALRREYDALASDASEAETVRRLAGEIKEAQKAYVAFRDLLLRLREDLEGFLGIYTREKLDEMQARKWTDELPQIDIADEIATATATTRGDDADEPVAANANSAWQTDAEVASRLEAAAAEVSTVREALETLRREHADLRSAHELAQEDLKYDDEIFEEKVRALKDLTTRERDALAQVAELKTANAQLAEMMRQMQEMAKKHGAAAAANGGTSTARSSAGAASARDTTDPSPLRSARGSGVADAYGAGVDDLHRLPEFLRAATSHLASAQEDLDEMRLAHDLDSTTGGSAALGFTPARSRPGTASRPTTASRPGTAARTPATATKSAQARSPPQPSAAEAAAAAEQAHFRAQVSLLRDHIASLCAARDDLAHAMSGLAAHIASRRTRHAAVTKSIEKRRRDLRIQLQMKRTAANEMDATVGASPAPVVVDPAEMVRQLHEAEQRYQGLEQELTLKRRLLAALSPRKAPAPSGGASASANVRRGVEAEVRDLEQALKQAGLALESLQLGATSPKASSAAAAATAGRFTPSSGARRESLAAEVARLEEAEKELDAESQAATESYAPAHSEDKATHTRMVEELAALDEEIAEARAQLEDAERQAGEHAEEEDADQPRMQVHVTPPTATDGELSARATPAKKAGDARSSLSATPATPAQLQTMKRKTQWLDHQVASFLVEHAALESLAASQAEQARLEHARQEVTKKKQAMLAKSLSASGMNMGELVRAAAASRPATSATADARKTSALNQSLHVVNTRLSSIDAQAHELMRQSHSQSSSRRDVSGSSAEMAALRAEMNDLERARAGLEAQRQAILAQLAEAVPPASSVSLGDADIVDAALLSRVLSREDRAQLEAFDEALDDLALQITLKTERIEEMTRGTAGEALLSQRGARPQTVTVGAAASPSQESDSAPVDLDAHRAVFLEKALAVFDPHDATEAAYVTRELVARAVERSARDAETRQTEETLRRDLAEKEALLARLETRVADVLAENEARVEAIENTWREKLAQVQQQQHQQLLSHDYSQSHSRTGLNSTVTSPTRGVKKVAKRVVDHPTSSADATPDTSLIIAAQGHSHARGDSDAFGGANGRPPFAPLRTFTPADLPLSVHTPLLYNQSPSVTPRSFAGTGGLDDFSPSRSARSVFEASAPASPHRASNIVGGVYTPHLSPTAQRLRASMANTNHNESVSVGGSAFGSAASSANVSAASSRATSALNSPAAVASNNSNTAARMTPEERQRVQLSLLKRKQSLRSSTHTPVPGAPAPAPAPVPAPAERAAQPVHHQHQHHQAHAHHPHHHHHHHSAHHPDDDDTDDFTRSSNFLSARGSNTASAAPRVPRAGPGPGVVPHLQFGAPPSHVATATTASGPSPLPSARDGARVERVFSHRT